MGKKDIYFFIDEYGTPALNEDKSPYFIYTGVMIDSSLIEKARKTLKAVSQKFNQGSPIKSNRIRNNEKGHRKRLNILNAFREEFPHSVFSLIIYKNELCSQGFNYKKSYIKFFINFFQKRCFPHAELFEYTCLHIVFDRTGSPEFQEDLRRYMNKHFPTGDLFTGHTFETKDDIDEEPLLQIADFYSGCIGRIFCDRIPEKQSRELYEVMSNYIFCDFFPRSRVNYLYTSKNSDCEFNQELLNIAIESAQVYLNLPDASPEGKEIVNYFLDENKFFPHYSITSQQIHNRLAARNMHVANAITEISHLRDYGVLIVSPSDQLGYKLPCNFEEVKKYYNRVLKNITPQLTRLNKLNELIAKNTVNHINILSENPKLRPLVELVTNSFPELLRQHRQEQQV